MYSAGGLFRWVAQGYKTEKDGIKLTAKEKREEGARRWAQGWRLYSTMDELRSGSSNST